MTRLILGLYMCITGFMLMIALLPVYRFDDITYVLNMHHLTGEFRVLLWFTLEFISFVVILFGLAVARLIPWR